MASETGGEAEAPLWAIAAEFDTALAASAAVRALRGTGAWRVDCFSPVPLPEVTDALSLHPTAVRNGAAVAALVGFVAMMGMCLYATVYDYRFNIGGRPLVSWPAFVVPSCSFALLCGALAAMLLMLFLNRLPRLNHPAFNIPGFVRASQDRFFLAVEARGQEGFEPEAVERAFARLALAPLAVHRVPL